MGVGEDSNVEINGAKYTYAWPFLIQINCLLSFKVTENINVLWAEGECMCKYTPMNGRCC